MGRKYQGDTLYWRILRDGKYSWKKADFIPAMNHLGEIELVVRMNRYFCPEEEE